MRAQPLVFNQFGGLVTAKDPKLIDHRSAQSLQNVILDDAILKQRLGYASANLTAPLAGATVRGLVYVGSYVGPTPLDEYVAFLEVAGTLRPYSINPITGARTEILNGGVSVSLPIGEWFGYSHDGVGYFWTPGQPMYKHELGNMNQFAALDDGQPNQQVSFPQITFAKTVPDPTQAGTNLLDWTSFVGADFTNNPDALVSPRLAVASYASTAGNVITVNGTDTPIMSQPPVIAFRMRDPAGVKDWSTATRFTFTMARVDGRSWFTVGLLEEFAAWSGYPNIIINPGLSGGIGDGSVRLRDNVGNVVECPVTVTERIAGGKYSYVVEGTIPADSRGSQWSDSRFMDVEISAPVNSLTLRHARSFTVTSITPDAPATATTPTNFATLTFAVAAYNEAMDVEALTPTDSAVYRMDTDADSMFYNSAAPTVFMGNQATINVEAGAISAMQANQGVTHWRAYVRFSDESNWRYLDEIELPTSTYIVPFTYDELRDRPERKEQTYTPIGAVRWSTRFLGWYVHATTGEIASIRHSAVGEIRTLAKLTDNADPEADLVDFNRGADFSITDLQSDEAIWAGGIGDTLVIIGRQGVYAQTGRRPIEMTPIRTLAGRIGGFAPNACAIWKDDSGRPAVVYLDSTGERLWLVSLSAALDSENEQRVWELSSVIDGSIRKLLFQGTIPTTTIERSRVQLVADARGDRLWLRYGNRALVLDRPVYNFKMSRATRPWLHHLFAAPSTGVSFERFSASQEYGLRSLLSNGAMREVFYAYAGGAFTPFEGATRDGGSVPPSSFWQSSTVQTSFVRHAQRVRLEKVNAADIITVRAQSMQGGVYSGDVTTTVESQREWARFTWQTRGTSIIYTFTLPNNGSGLLNASVDEVAISRGSHK